MSDAHPHRPPTPNWVASRLQERFEGLVDEPADGIRSATAPPMRAASHERYRLPASGPRSGDEATQHQLDDLRAQLTVLREQLDLAFEDLELRLDTAETRASLAETRAGVAESRANVAESRAADAERRAHAALELVTALERRLVGEGEHTDATDGGGNLRSALDRLRNRLDAGAG